MIQTHFDRAVGVTNIYRAKAESILARFPDAADVVSYVAAEMLTHIADQRTLSMGEMSAVLERLVDREIVRRRHLPYAEIIQEIERSGFHRQLAMLTGSSGASSLSVTYAQAWHMRRFQDSGERVYEVSPGLASRLVRTRLTGLTTDNLCDTAILPYESIYIAIPPEAGLVVENIDSGTHPVEGMYVTRDSMLGIPAWRIMVIGSPKDGNVYDDAIFHFILPLPTGVALDVALDAEHGRIMGRISNGGIFNEAEKKCIDLMPGFFRFAMNTVFYATSADARRREGWNHPHAARLIEQAAKHKKGTHKGDRARAALKAAQLRSRTFLGDGLPVLTSAGSSGSHGPLIVRTLVEGHWRNQAHGPRHSLRKLIFIEPFWRGPEDAPESIPTHVLR